MSLFETMDSLPPIVEAVLGGVISIMLVAVVRWSWPWIMGQLRRVYDWLALRPVLRQVMIGALGGILVLTGTQLDALQGDVLKVQTGSITLDPRDPGYSLLTEVNVGECPKEQGRRGDLNRRVSFPEPFLSPPKVLIAFSIIETDLEVGNRGTRLVVQATHVDREGFNYDLYTWCNGQVWWVRASWMAVGK